MLRLIANMKAFRRETEKEIFSSKVRSLVIINRYFDLLGFFSNGYLVFPFATL